MLNGSWYVISDGSLNLLNACPHQQLFTVMSPDELLDCWPDAMRWTPGDNE